LRFDNQFGSFQLGLEPFILSLQVSQLAGLRIGFAASFG
jgi:hypothetical protein